MPRKELTDDLVQPFQLETSHLRGRLVRLGPALEVILNQHNYPDPLGILLGEAVVIAAALAASLKYNGVFTLQAKGDGAVKIIVADVTSDGGLRAYASGAKEGAFELGETKGKSLLGKGYLAFTVSEKTKEERYQGIVELLGRTLAEGVQHYFLQSEQIPTGIVAAVRKDNAGRWRGGCLMLQRIPREGGLWSELETGMDVQRDTSREDDWHRSMLLMGTCTEDELTDPNLTANELLFRLFNEEGVRVFEPHACRHQCRCSQERVESMLISLPKIEVEALAVNGVVDVTCEFCNRSYLFDQKQREALYLRE